MYIGIIVKDRLDCLKVLLKSLQPNIENVRIVDASDKPLYDQVKEYLPGVRKYIHNSLPNFKSVNHNKNILIHDFLMSGEDYLFLIEDDVQIINNDCFKEYIRISEKYKLVHLNAILKQDHKNYIKYTLASEVDICNILYGYFSFYSRECVETAGLYSTELSNQCWEHIEYTARIHQKFDFKPEFFHFPDIKDSFKMIQYQNAPTTSKTSKEIILQDKLKMFKMLKWKSFPTEVIKMIKLINI